MARFSLRRFDHQARVGVVLSLASVLPLLAMGYLLAGQIDTSSWTFFYGPQRAMAYFGAGLAAMGLAAGGFGFGLNSAGQRRNDKPVLSWIAFFVGGAVFCLAVLLLMFFRLRGESAIG